MQGALRGPGFNSTPGQKKEIKDKKFDEKFDQVMELADVLGTAASLFLEPWFLIGKLVLIKRIVSAIDIAETLYAASNSKTEKLKTIFRDKTIEMIFDSMEMFYPTWAHFAASAKEGSKYATALYDDVKEKYLLCTMNSTQSDDSKIEVPADVTLRQIYRFRCIADPKFVGEMSAMDRMFKRWSSAKSDFDARQRL